MKKKRYLIIALVLFAFVACGAGVLIFVGAKYVHTGLARFDARDEALTWNGKLLLSEDGEYALQYHPEERIKYEKKERVTVDLSPYGFEGASFSYFHYDGLALCPDEGYEGLWPVSTPRRFLYRAEDGLYQIDTEQGRAWPVFADSVPGVPETGEGVLAFSANGTFALSLSDGIATVYHTDPMNDSLRVVDTKTADLAQWGEKAAFVAFTGDRYAAFSLTHNGEEAYAALDCETGETVLCPTDFSIERGEKLSRFFAQRPLNEEEKGRYAAAWTNLLLGTDTFCTGKVDAPTLISVSPQGSHAAARQENQVWILSENRAFSLTGVLAGERVLAVDFIYENVIAVSVLKDDRPCTYSYTVLF